MPAWIAAMSSVVDAAPVPFVLAALVLGVVVYGPRRRRRRRTSPDFRNSVVILGVMWAACVLMLGVLLLLKR
jgi:MYXO-CTERM domain-containing protein